jgi:hypothetical protein
LPERARAYIAQLEEQVKALQSQNDRTADKLRKANWAKWNKGR